MDEEKKSEANGGEPERLGPYQLEEHVTHPKRGEGELFLATHETSGTKALVLKPPAGDGAEPLGDWRVRCISSASPGYLALEVEQTPWAVAPGEESAESLACAFEDVHAGMRRMAQAFPTPPEPRPWRRLGLAALAGAAVMGALLFALNRSGPESSRPGSPDPLAGAAPWGPVLPTDAGTPASGWLAGTTPPEQPVVSRPLPREPFKGQKRPPCTRYVEVELVGACWAPHELKAPCPDALYEHEGKCYLPSFNAKPPSQSVEQ